MKKKAQTEIIGLMVIVILFVFVGLIYIMFAGKGDQGRLTEDVTQTGKVQNMLDAFVQLTPCYEKTPFDQMDEIIKECYTSAGTDIVCEKNCKTFITDTLDELMKAYNDKQSYEFYILEPDKTEFIEAEQKCLGTAETRAATDRVLAGGQALTLKLVYCIL